MNAVSAVQEDYGKKNTAKSSIIIENFPKFNGDEKFSENQDLWCKISLLNLIMSNNFGYYNMCM